MGAIMTAVMKAVRNNDAAAIDKLIAGGADVNELDPTGDAPLVMAAYIWDTPRLCGGC
jgi:ankyrin repeat protein